jgi:hypothetical protein
MSEELKAIRAAYYEAGRVQPADYPPLPSWQSLPIELREAFIHVYGAAAPQPSGGQAMNEPEAP